METQTLQRVETAVDAGTVWSIDPDHSTIGFSVKHMLIATVHGRFNDFRGKIRFAEDRPPDAFVEVQIDAASIDTGITRRDEHCARRTSSTSPPTPPSRFAARASNRSAHFAATAGFSSAT
jgi:hypothetical protein